MKIKIHYRDNEPPLCIEHAGNIKIVTPGVYHIENKQNELITQVPLDVVRRLEICDKDTNIALVG